MFVEFRIFVMAAGKMETTANKMLMLRIMIRSWGVIVTATPRLQQSRYSVTRWFSVLVPKVQSDMEGRLFALDYRMR
jgi:hypothetical protein